MVADVRVPRKPAVRKRRTSLHIRTVDRGARPAGDLNVLRIAVTLDPIVRASACASRQLSKKHTPRDSSPRTRFDVLDLALLIERELLAQKQILGCERSSGAQTETQKMD